MRLFPTPFLLLLPALLFAAAPEAPYLRVGVDQPITVPLYARPSGFTPTHITWTQVPDRINHLNTNGVATLVPHGQPLPTTAWNADRTVLTVNLGGGLTNTIRFDRTNPDHRTRLAWHQGETH